MKKNYFKKSLSLVMAVLMVLSCWVWVAPEHAEAALAYDTPAVTGTSKQDKTFKVVRTDNTSDYVQIKYPSTMYLDINEDLQSTGYSVNLSTNFGDSNNHTLYVFPSCWGGQAYNDGDSGVGTASVNLKDQTQLVDNFTEYGLSNGNLAGYFGNYSIDSADHAVFTCTKAGSDIGTNGINMPFHGTPKKEGTFVFDLSKNSGDATLARFKKTGGFMGYGNYDKTTYDSNLSSTDNVKITIIVYNKYDLSAAIKLAEETYPTTDELKYTSATWSAYQTALNKAKDILKTREVTQGAADSTDTNTINGAKNALEKATAGLVKQYKITWKNWDGTELKSEYFAINTTPKYSGTTPTKPNDGVVYNGKNKFSYEFTGWSPEIKNATADATYTAQFRQVTNFYIVTFDLANDRTDVVKTYTPGSTIPAEDIPALSTREPEADKHFSYKWEPSIGTVTGDITYIDKMVSDGHDYGEWKVVEGEAPTCSKDGKKERFCSVCNYRQEEDDTERPNHNIISAKDYKDSSCTEEGNIAYYKCTNCGTLFSDSAGTDVITIEDTVIKKKDHVYGDPIKGSGNDDYHELQCKTCEDRKTQAHTYIPDLDSETTATCITAGTSTETCAFCQRTKTIYGEIDPDNHVNKVKVGEKAATCTEPGYTGDTYCNDCKKTVENGTTIPALGHKFEGAYVSNNNGTHVQKCTRVDCEATGNEQPCTYGNWTTDDVATHSHTCTACNYTPEAENHIWSDWTPADGNTENAAGKMTHECTVCGRTETTDCTKYEQIAHTDATCDAAETTTYKCSDCGHTYKVIGKAALGHKFDGAYVSNNNGTHVQKCTNSGCTATGNEKSCTYGDWTKDNATTHSHTCTACNYTPKAENHNWSKWAPVDANATTQGKMTRECTVCGRTETTVCTYGEVYTKPTCTNDAYTTYTCADCGHGYTVIHQNTATGHKFTGEYKFDANADKHQQLCANGCGAYGVGTVAGEWADCSWSYENVEAGKHTATCVCGNSEEQACSGGQATCTAKAKCQFCKTEYGSKSDHSFTGTVVKLEGDFHAFRCKFCNDETIYGVESKQGDSVPCSGGSATCTALAICSVCGDTHGVLNADAHKWGAPATEKNDTEHTHKYTCEYNDAHTKTEACAPAVDSVVAPTCEKDGYTVQKCQLCGATWHTDPVTALGHEWGAWANNGNGTHTKTCVRQGCCYGENGAAKTETASCTKENATVVVTDPTCIAEGFSTYTCKDCGYVWVDDKVPALGHNYSTKIYKPEYLFKAQDCTTCNIYFFACSRCGKNGKNEEDTAKYTNLKFEADKPLGHDWTDKVDAKYHISDATCTEAAKYYKSCSRCEIPSEETFTSGTALGHKWVKPSETELENNEELTAVRPDCETDAQYYYVCEVESCRVSSKGLKTDGETWTVTNDDKPGRHGTMIAVAGVTGDCENDTILAHYYCKDCGKKFKDADGKEAFVGSTVIRAPGHSWIKYKAVDATCETNGHAEYDKCSVCSIIKCGNNPPTYDINEVPSYKKTGHNFTADAGYFIDEVNDYHAYYCANAKCLPATDDNGEAVKDARGRAVYNKAYGAVVDGVQVKYAVTDNGDGTVTVVGGFKCSFDSSTTTTVNGVHSHNNVCACSNSISTVYTDESPETVAPNCTDEGYKLHKCVACGEEWKTDRVEPKGHTLATTGISNGDGTHSLKCIVDGCNYKKDTVRCSGGTATCKAQAICDICYGAYGDTLPHTLSDSNWSYNGDAKCGIDGTESQTCSECSATVTRKKAGSALNHEYLPEYTYSISGWANKPADFNLTIKEPTCKENGLAINYCVNEGCSHYNTKVMKASTAYHKITETTIAGNCTTGAKTIKACSVCDYSETIISAPVDHKWLETGRELPTCTYSGSIYYVCEACGEKAELNEITADFTDSNYVMFKGMKVDISGIKTLGHSWGNLAIESAATCSRDGKGKHTCNVCKKTETVTIDKIEGAHIIGHKNSTLKRVPASAPTCKVPGNREYYECMSCPYSQNANDDYKLGVIDHKDSDGDGRCDTCYEPMDKATIDDGCICHKKGFSAFIYKILRTFWKLFKMKKTCDCGVEHY